MTISEGKVKPIVIRNKIAKRMAVISNDTSGSISINAVGRPVAVCSERRTAPSNAMVVSSVQHRKGFYLWGTAGVLLATVPSSGAAC